MCFYISKTSLWPYASSGSTNNRASDQCYNIGLGLAEIRTEAERTALWNAAGKGPIGIDQLSSKIGLLIPPVIIWCEILSVPQIRNNI